VVIIFTNTRPWVIADATFMAVIVKALSPNKVQEVRAIMNMCEFLALTEDEKVEVIAKVEGEYLKATEDTGACSQCSKKADVGDYCFGCKKLVCQECFEEEPHLSDCVSK